MNIFCCKKKKKKKMKGYCTAESKSAWEGLGYCNCCRSSVSISGHIRPLHRLRRKEKKNLLLWRYKLNHPTEPSDCDTPGVHLEDFEEAIPQWIVPGG